jgi:hypothetical protein
MRGVATFSRRTHEGRRATTFPIRVSRYPHPPIPFPAGNLNPGLRYRGFSFVLSLPRAPSFTARAPARSDAIFEAPATQLKVPDKGDAHVS